MKNGKPLALSSIHVRTDRQRQDLKDIESLAQSIAKNGLINPILLDENNTLVAGERRFRAHELLGYTHIDVRYTSELDESDLQRIELEENLKRADLTWKEECLAVANYHALLCKANPDWTIGQTAIELSTSDSYVSWRISISEHLAKGAQLVVDADSITVARNAVLRLNQRAEADVTSAIDSAFSNIVTPEVIGTPAAKPSSSPANSPEAKGGALPSVPTAPKAATEEAKPPIVCGDFLEFVESYSGPRFNFLHCDFPYGIDAGKHNQGAAKHMGKYEDSRDIYFTLLNALVDFTRIHVADNAHMMFWYAPKYRRETEDLLEAAGWKINPYPLIWWRSDNAGIIPDTKRSGRQVYEMAMHCTRGDLFVVQPVSNLFPSPKTKEIHGSEKPRPMLDHFFRMFISDNTVMLDPTCGSGNSVNMALRRGAKSALGIEKDPDFVARALALLERTKDAEDY